MPQIYKMDGKDAKFDGRVCLSSRKNAAQLYTCTHVRKTQNDRTRPGDSQLHDRKEVERQANHWSSTQKGEDKCGKFNCVNIENLLL